MHSISVIITKRSVLEDFGQRYRHAHVRGLAQGFALVPLTKELYEEISGDPLHHRIADPDAPFPGFDDSILEALLDLSLRGKVGYVETDYFGGAGSQSAIGWKGGTPFFGPRPAGEPPVSHLLRLMGVEKGDHLDEFEALGLNRFRTTDAWVNSKDAGASER